MTFLFTPLAFIPLIRCLIFRYFRRNHAFLSSCRSGAVISQYRASRSLFDNYSWHREHLPVNIMLVAFKTGFPSGFFIIVISFRTVDLRAISAYITQSAPARNGRSICTGVKIASHGTSHVSILEMVTFHLEEINIGNNDWACSPLVGILLNGLWRRSPDYSI